MNVLHSEELIRGDLETRKRNEIAMRRIIEEGFNEGKLEIADELVSTDIVENQFFGPRHPKGPEGLKAIIRDLRRMLPDVKLTIEDMVSEDDKVWIRMRSEGTHLGEFMGRPASGKRVTVDVFDLCRFKDGKMVEHWGVPDRFHLLMQIGFFQRPEENTPKD